MIAEKLKQFTNTNPDIRELQYLRNQGEWAEGVNNYFERSLKSMRNFPKLTLLDAKRIWYNHKHLKRG